MPSTRTEVRYLLDVNVLLALAVGEHVHHPSAVRWFADHAASAVWATTPLTESGLVRLLLNPRVYGAPLTPHEAAGALARLRTAPGWTFLPDDSSLAQAAIDLTAMVGHRQVTDFHLLNLAAEHDHLLVTFDRALATYLTPEDRARAIIIPVG